MEDLDDIALSAILFVTEALKKKTFPQVWHNVEAGSAILYVNHFVLIAVMLLAWIFVFSRVLSQQIHILE